ncbi:beta-defensin 128 [Apodemus sylvaticus]|uniref:beta-defensin 128 n=1 Tax=Apodemus sylvaticus TaxID=10129 RepID=UPI0022433756|nr:beta-defensin 128 [Apodemus sylvaticus]
MKLPQVLIILLFVALADAAQPKRCFSSIAGFCRKKCRLVEISEMGCLRGKYCCVNELEYKKHKKHAIIEQPARPKDKSKVQDYILLPTVTYYTITIQ